MDHVQESRKSYSRGLALSASGMFIISPDGLLLRSIEQADIWQIVFYRSLFLGISLACVLGARYRLRTARVVHSCGRLGLLSALLMSVANISFIGAITETTVANTLVILATMPLFSAVFGAVLIGEVVQTRTWIAILAAGVGIAIIFADSLGGGSWMGNFLAVVTALSHGLNLVVLRQARQQDMMPPLCLSGFLSALVVLPLAVPTPLITSDFAILAVLGFVVLPLSLSLFLSGTRWVPAVEVALLALVETVLGPIWVWLGVGEVPTALSFFGGVIVVATLAINALLALRGRTA